MDHIKAKRRLRTAIRYSPEEGWTLALAISGLQLSSNPQCTLYRLADIDTLLNETIDCDGVPRRIKLVLKAYVKVTPREAKAQRQNKLYLRLLRGKRPTFL